MGSVINIGDEIEKLIQFALSKKLIDCCDALVVRNNLIDFLRLKNPYSDDAPPPDYSRSFDETEAPQDADDIRNNLLQYCYENGILPDATVTQRDLASARIMGFITPKPTEVAKRFQKEYMKSPMDATDYLYKLCLDVNYIHGARLKKNFNWDNEEPYGRLEFVNSFQKPEKTEQEIRLRDEAEKPGYPLCELCVENVGFPGNLWHPAKQNLRLVPLTLAGRQYYLQYDWEQYYSERLLVTDAIHRPMEITEKTFEIMLDFVDKFPHCFIGLEATLPGLGNKYKEHGCFQGGCHVFPIEFAEAIISYRHEIFSGVSAGILNWPVSVMRLESGDAFQLKNVISYIGNFWKEYEDEAADIIAYTEQLGVRIPHNAITVAIRKNVRGSFEADVALRNNRTSDGFPHGVFCPRPEHFHMKEGEIGLVDIMGRGVFPETFERVLLHIMSSLMSGKKDNSPHLERHSEWIDVIMEKYGIESNYKTARSVVQFEAARKFAAILKDCGVFQMTEEGLEGFKTFMNDLGFSEEDEY